MNSFPKVIIVFSIIALLFGCNDGMTESQHLAKAKEFAGKGEFKAASIELKNALQKNPKNPQVRLELGKLHLELGDMAGAEKELSKALALGAEHEQILPFLGRSLLYQGKFDELMALSVNDLKAGSKSEVLAYKGLSLIAQGDMQKASLVIDMAMAASDTSLYAMVANASVLGYTKETEKSRKQLEAALKINSEFAPAWSLLADIELNDKKYELALDAYTKAISLRANNMSDMLKRSMVLLQLKQYDKAQKDIDYLKSRVPLHPGFNYVQGLIHFLNKNYQDAQAAFDLALVDEKRYSMALYYAGLTNYILGQHGRAEKYATQYFSKFPQFPAAQRLLAVIKLGNQRYKEAEELIRPLVEAGGSDPGAMNILATALLKQGETNESIDLLSKVVELNPDSPDAQTRLGVGLMLSGNVTAGETHLSTAVQLDSSNERGEILLIINYLRQKQFDKALAAAKAFNVQFPDTATSYNVLGQVYQLTGKKQEAEEAFIKALNVEPGNPSASQNLAVMAIKDKDYAKARGYYSKALEKNAKHLGILIKSAALDALDNNEKSMVNHLQLAIDAHPTAAQPKLVLARYYLTQGEHEKVALLIGQFNQAQMKSPIILELVSLAQLAKGDYIGAKNTVRLYLEKNPNSAPAHFRLANAYGGLKQPTKMRVELEKAIELAPEHLPARLAIAKLAVSLREKDLVARHLAVLIKLAPTHPEVRKIEVSQALLEGNTGKALEMAEDLFKTAPSSRNLLVFSGIKWNTGDRDGTVQLLNDWLVQNPDDVQMRLALAGRYLLTEKEDLAVSEYKKILLIDKDNLIALNNLAWFLRDSELEKALGYARYANRIGKQAPALMDTLAMILLKKNELGEAQKTINEAMIKAPKNLSIQYHGAKIFAAAGDKAGAVRVLRKLTGDEINFSDKDAAVELLKTLQVETE